VNEDVMVVETALLQPFFTAPLIRDHTAAILDIIAVNHTFIARAIAEVSPEWKQIIPYVVIRRDNEFFVLKRTSPASSGAPIAFTRRANCASFPAPIIRSPSPAR